MFQEAPHDGAHADVLGQARHAGAQRAYAAHDEVDFHAGLAGLVELLDDALFEQRVHLGHDARALAGLGGARLGADGRDHAVVQREGRLQQRLERAAGAQAGELGEHLVHVFAQAGVGGQQAEVGVEPRRAGMVVARAEVRIAAQPAFFAAQHQGHLGVGLVRHHAVHHVRPHLLEAGRPVDVGLLVEARHQLHHHRHFLAGPRRGQQDLHQLGILAGAVDGLLDGHDVRVQRGGRQEIDDG
ncbi:hypothetical protein AD428_23735, partial [Achromobacter sp. DMS1]